MFNTEKLDWMNSQHIMRMDTRELAGRVEPFLRDAGLWDDAYAGARQDWFCAVLELFKPRAKRLTEFVERGRPFFADVTEYDAAAQKKLWAAPETRDLLTRWPIAWPPSIRSIRRRSSRSCARSPTSAPSRRRR